MLRLQQHMSNLLGFERERCLEVIAAPQDGIRFIDALEAAVKLIAIVKTQDILSVCEKAKPEAEGEKEARHGEGNHFS